MPPEDKDIFVISNIGLNAELDKIDNDIKKTTFEDTLKLIGKWKWFWHRKEFSVTTQGTWEIVT